MDASRACQRVWHACLLSECTPDEPKTSAGWETFLLPNQLITPKTGPQSKGMLLINKSTHLVCLNSVCVKSTYLVVKKLDIILRYSLSIFINTLHCLHNSHLLFLMLTAMLRNERDRVDCQDLMSKTLTRFPCNESLPCVPGFGCFLGNARGQCPSPGGSGEGWEVARRGSTTS